MKNLYQLLPVILLFNHFAAKAQELLPEDYVKELGAAYLSTPGAQGLSIVVFSDGEEKDYHFGTVEKGGGRLPNSQTLYELGSITKVFASTVLAHAVNENKVTLDDDIRKFLPGKYPNLNYQGKPIKLVHLADLTSGLPNWIPDHAQLFQNTQQDSIPFVLLSQHRNYKKEDFYKDLHKVVLNAAPGSNAKHSNAAAQLLGFILEEIYHRPFADLVKQYITGPLEMNSTVMQPVQSANLAKGYNASGLAMPYIDTEDFQASSELVSTTIDMLKFIKAQLDRKNKAMQLTHQVTCTSPQDSVGLNWHLDGSKGENRSLWHTGGTFGFSSYIVLYPQLHTGIVLMANESDPQTQNKLAGIASGIIDRIKETKVEKKK